MINANQAALLYIEPPYTEAEVDEKIRDVATRGNCTVFDKQRLTAVMAEKLSAAGFSVLASGMKTFVSWENA